MKYVKCIKIIIVLSVGFIYVSCNNISNQWMPQWKVGDWWIVKTQSRIWAAGFAPPEGYDPFKTPHAGQLLYKVIDEENVNGQLCFALEQKGLPIDSDFPERRVVAYFRKEDFLLIREIDYSYSNIQGAPAKPCTVEYSCNKGFPSLNPYKEHMPVFPLFLKGPKADSLAKGYLAQKVFARRIEDFKQQFQDLKHIDTIPIKKGNCYLVNIEQTPRYIMRQIWVSSLPWFLYQESGGKTKDGRDTIMQRRWLSDYSGWSRK
jgi:hypothetical protein